ncbi:MAG: hypothetical protein Q8Q58_13790 [Candidatus Rokubacteria bacterium]|nr:hypothetical protein [Candidatus Rokubacteria bacterium]
MVRWRCLVLLLATLVAAGCLLTGRQDDVQRATEGATADELYMVRFVRGYGRLPTFDESQKFRDELDRRVADYLNKNSQLGSSPRASQFRFHRRVSVGMTKDEVTLLAESPDGTTQDEAVMKAAAKKFWPAIQPRAKEMWIYPGGWQFYFDGDRLADITVAGKPPLE